VLDSRTLQSTPESGPRAGYDSHQRKQGSTIPLAVDTLGHLLALHVTAASAPDRALAATLSAAVQAATADAVTLAYVDQGYTGIQPATDTAAHGIRPEVVTLPEAKRGFAAGPGAGSSSAVSLGRAGSDAWPTTMNASPKPRRACLSLPLPA